MMEKSGQKSLKRKRENVVGLDGSDFQKFAKKKKDKKSSKTSIVEKVTSGTDPALAIQPVGNGSLKTEPEPKSKKRKKQRNKKKKSHVAALPVKPDDISSNWKNLMKTLEAEKQAKKQNPVVFFSAKRRKKFEEVKAYSAKKQPVQMEEAKKKPEIWFDDVDETLLDPEDRPSLSADAIRDADDPGTSAAEKALVKERAFKGPTKIIGIDCEMVGVGFGGKDSVLARVSIVNHFGHCIYDKYVKPREKVTDYRTAVSGIRPEDIQNAEDFKVVQKEVSDLLQNRILVGHSLKHDLKVLFLDHPRKLIRDTSTYKYFRNAFGGKTPSLKRLSERMLGVKVQEGEHSSVQDAQAAVRLYTMFRKQWEGDIKNKDKKGLRLKTDDEMTTVPTNTENVVRQNVSSMKLPLAKKASVKKESRPLYTDSD